MIKYRDHFQHFGLGDVAVTVQIVHVEGPFDFVLHGASVGDGQGAQELSEVDGTVTVDVESPEHVLGELSVKFIFTLKVSGVGERKVMLFS